MEVKKTSKTLKSVGDASIMQRSIDMYRKSIPMKKSKKLFTKTASRTHYKNVQPKAQRGGTRM